MMIKLANPTTNNNRWLMADVWTSSCHMDTNGANLTCWLCLINCRFDNSNIIWHYTREKKLLCSQLLSVKKRHWWGFVPEIIFVVFDVTSSPHPSNLLLLSIFLAVYQWLHSIIVQTIRLKTKHNNIYNSINHIKHYCQEQKTCAACHIVLDVSMKQICLFVKDCTCTVIYNWNSIAFCFTFDR